MKYAHTAVVALVAALMLSAVQLPGYAGNKYRLITALGDVKILTGKTSRSAVRGQELDGAQTIVTGKNSMADVSLGGRGIMRIQANTKLAVASIDKKTGPDLDMEKGGVLVIMSKLGKGASYQVKTRTQVVSVRGTIFQVSGDEAKSQLDVFTGKVLVNPITDGEIQSKITQMVTEGQSLSLDKATIVDIIANKRKISLSAIRSEVKDAFVKQALVLRETPEFKSLGADTKNELNNRVQRLRDELKAKGLDTQTIKDKLLEKGSLKEQGLDKELLQEKLLQKKTEKAKALNNESVKETLKSRKQELLDKLKNR